MGSSNKRKKYNPLKSAELTARSLLRNFGACKIVGREYVEGVDIRTGQVVNVSAHIASILENFAFPWNVECSILCRDQQGSEYIVSETIVCQSAYRHSDERLMAILNDNHQRLMKECNPLHIITAAWIAVPVLKPGQEIDMSKCERIYTLLGGFNYLSKWESENE